MNPSLDVAAPAALTLEVDDDNVVWLVFDRPDSKVNLLSADVMARLDELIGEIERLQDERGIRAVIVRSAKDGTFIAGADVNEIAGIRDATEGYDASRTGQRIFRRLELLSVPTVAAIDGLCLGGGTELALACDYRLASDRPQTKIGLPEVRLGIIPGFGGTTRLPRLIGLTQALPIILTGQPVSASKARRIGMVDEAVHPAILYDRAKKAALAGRLSPRRKRPLRLRLLDETIPGRALALNRARAGVMKETHGHYPAPLLALDVIRSSLGQPLDVAFELEARGIGSLLASPVSKHLIHVFHLMEGARKAGPQGVRPQPVRRVAVLGAGVMGGGIAQLLAFNDITVRLKDVDARAMGNGLRHARSIFDRAVRRGRMTQRVASRHMDAIAPTLDYSGFGSVDLVIEAIVERMDVKQKVLREVEAQVSPDCVLASNTSSLSITVMQSALARPGNFCGLHFFNPVHRMPLVEVIRGEHTSDVALATAFALARRLDKTPVLVNDGPGFLVNRVLAPYLNEAGFLLQEGASIRAIDRALLDFGMPMGPLRLLDEVGLDVARHVAEVMHEGLGDRMRPAAALAALEGTELLGRKGGRGFYVYDGERQRGINDEIYERLAPCVPAKRVDIEADVIRTRTVLAMVNEAARVLEDGIARNAGDVDLAMITGTGFPPFRGGLLRYADDVGLALIRDRLDELTSAVGARFTTAGLIRELADAQRGFYG